MSSLPIHPQFVHLPLALGLILPLLALVLAFLVRSDKFPRQVWMIVVGLQILATVSGYVAMSLGEEDEEVVEKVVGKEFLHEHEERAEMFVAASVAASAVSIVVIMVKLPLQFPLMIVTFVLMLAQLFLGIRTGQSGGELVYVHKAAQAYSGKVAPEAQGLLPTPGMNTSESEHPQDDNEYTAGEAVEEDDSEAEDDGE